MICNERVDAAGWLESLRSLRDDQRAVVHQPETARYARARAKLRYLLASSVALGVRPSEIGSRSAVEIACWARPSTGRGHGYFSAFRLYREEGVAVLGVLFCFYDGTESSPGFRSAAAARAHALSTGFREVLDEDVHRD